MKSWASFYPDVLIHVPAAPDPLIDQELRRAASEYFRRTRAWVEWLPSITTDAATRTYGLDIPAGATVVALERAALDGTPIDILIWRESPTDPEAAASGVLGIGSRDRMDITIEKTPADGQALSVQVSLMPSRTATGLPDHLFEQHADAIRAGALSRLLLLPGQPYSNPAMAAVHRQTYEVELASAAVHAYRGETNITPRRRPTWI